MVELLLGRTLVFPDLSRRERTVTFTLDYIDTSTGKLCQQKVSQVFTCVDDTFRRLKRQWHSITVSRWFPGACAWGLHCHLSQLAPLLLSV